MTYLLLKHIIRWNIFSLFFTFGIYFLPLQNCLNDDFSSQATIYGVLTFHEIFSSDNVGIIVCKYKSRFSSLEPLKFVGCVFTIYQHENASICTPNPEYSLYFETWHINVRFTRDVQPFCALVRNYGRSRRNSCFILTLKIEFC